MVTKEEEEEEINGEARVPREVVAGGEGGAAGRQDGLVGELLELEQGRDLGDLVRGLDADVDCGGAVRCGHGEG